jgi:hypothetical protein
MRIYVKFPDGTKDEYEVESVEFPHKVVIEVKELYGFCIREASCEVNH